ncbi:MAG: DUF2800 domain-containing protein, partial [Planctomycetes bacterium]|nr:DUF2800 domain-containing protein [Planctomycetota bacterium]
AKLSPSGSTRWLACPGSIEAEAAIDEPEVESEAAREGTRAHQLLEECIKKNIDPGSFLTLEDE